MIVEFVELLVMIVRKILVLNELLVKKIYNLNVIMCIFGIFKFICNLK